MEIELEDREYTITEIFDLAGINIDNQPLFMLKGYLRNIERKGYEEIAEPLKNYITSKFGKEAL
jgi:hypothetical protein